MKKHSITIISHSFPSLQLPVNGIFVKDQADWLSVFYEIKVIAPRPRTIKALTKISKKWAAYHKIPLKIFTDNYQVLRPEYLTFPKKLFYKQMGYNFLSAVKKYLEESDVFHIHFAYPGLMLVPYISKLYPAARIVLTIHGNDWYINIKNKKIKHLIRKNLRKVDDIIVVGEKLKIDISKVFPEYLHKIHVVSNGIKLPELQENNNKSEKNNDLNILMVGAYTEGKGLHVLLKSLTKINIATYHLTVIGNVISERYYNQMQEMCKEYGLEDKVNLLTSQTREHLYQYYQSCDFLILPSLSEGFGIALIEAMSFGKPVLSTRSGGPEDIVNDKNGILVSPNDNIALARGIEKMSKTFKEYNSQDIIDNVGEQFSHKNTVNKLNDIYNIEKRFKKVCHLTSIHSRVDVRIYQKEVLSLRSYGYKVDLVVADGKGDDPEKNIYDVGKSVNRFDRIGKISQKIYKQAVFLDADIYHFHDPELIGIGRRLKRMGKIVIYDMHEDLPRQVLTKEYLKLFPQKLLSKIVERWENYNAKYFNTLITSTEHIKTRMLRHNPNVVSIKNYPKIGEFIFKHTSHEVDQYACYIGGISKGRGIIEIIQACNISSVKLKIAGRFLDSECQNEVERMPEWQNVEYLGMQDRESISNLLENASVGFVTLHPIKSYIDSLPVKMFEYMVSKTPVIASDFPLWKSIIEENKCGVCIDPLDADKISNALNTLIKKPELAIKMGEYGRSAVLEKYNWAIEEKKLLKLYNEIADNHE